MVRARTHDGDVRVTGAARRSFDCMNLGSEATTSWEGAGPILSRGPFY